MLWKVVVAALTLATAAATSGCAKEKDGADRRASFTVQANLFCETLRTELIALPRPLTHRQLRRYLARARDATRTAAAGLHDARRALDGDATAQIGAFDRQADSVLEQTAELSDRTATIGLDPDRDQQRSLLVQAERARGAFATLRRTAQVAGPKRCGLGGDELADAVQFTSYRTQYLRIQDATFAGLRRAPFQRADSLSRYLRKARRYLAIRSAEYRRVRRLTPPPELRAPHDTLVDRFADAIGADRELQSAFYRGRLRAISSATSRLQRMDRRYFAAERTLRRLLNRRA